MKLSFVAESRHLAIDGEAHVIETSVASELLDARTIAIHWNETAGTIERKSRVAGRVDFEHFDDVKLLEPFEQAFMVHKAKLALEAEKREAAAAEARAQREKEIADFEARNREAMKAQNLPAVG